MLKSCGLREHPSNLTVKQCCALTRDTSNSTAPASEGGRYTCCYSQRANRVPSGTIVASRSGPVEIMPISTCRNSLMKRMYSTAALGNLLASFSPYVDWHQPGSDVYSG